MMNHFWVIVGICILLVGCQSADNNAEIADSFWSSTWGVIILLIAFIIVGAIILVLFWLAPELLRPKFRVLKPFYDNLDNKTAAYFTFRRSYHIVSYNGQRVKWSPFLAKATSILLPPGKCHLVFNLYDKQLGDSTITASGHQVMATIEAGKTYFMWSDYSKVTNTLATYIKEGTDEDLKDYVSFMRFAVNRY